MTVMQARATPLAPYQWKQMLANAQLLKPANQSQHIDPNQSQQIDANQSHHNDANHSHHVDPGLVKAADLRPDSTAESSASVEEEDPNATLRGQHPNGSVNGVTETNESVNGTQEAHGSMNGVQEPNGSIDGVQERNGSHS